MVKQNKRVYLSSPHMSGGEKRYIEDCYQDFLKEIKTKFDHERLSRIEKAFRHWGHDIGIKDTILEAGLGFTCAFNKKVPFIGRDAVLKQKEVGKLTRRMVQFKLSDPEKLLYHNEPIYRDGQLVGLVTSANYGHHLGGAIGMGYVHHKEGVDADLIATGRFEIGVALKRCKAEASLVPMYDPKSARMRA